MLRKFIESHVKVLAVLALITVILFALKQRSEKDNSQNTGSQDTTLKNQVQYQKVDKVPEDFPKDFPIFPNSEFDSGFVASGSEKKSVSVIWRVLADSDEVKNFYETKLNEEGWKIISFYEEEGSKTFSFEKLTIKGFAGIAEIESGGVVISVTIGEEFRTP